jgi:DNA-binding transcriptional regulator YhcF (GntR family)
MLTTQQINEIRTKSGLAPKVSTADNYVGKYDYLKKQSMGQETIEDIRQTGSNLKETFNRTKGKIQGIADAEVRGEQGKLRSFGQAFGTVAGGVSRGIGDVLMGAIKSVLPQAGEDAVKKGIEVIIQESAPILTQLDKALGRPVGSTIEAYKNLPEKSKRDVDSLLGISAFALDVASAGVAKKAGKKAIDTGVDITKKVAQETAKQGKKLVTKGDELLGQAKSKIPEIISPSPKPLEAVGQVLQGKTKDIKAGLQSIANLDTSKVKTFKDLENVITDKIKELAGKVDVDLSADKTVKKLKDLKVVTKTASGAKVVSQPVKRALDQLLELYNKIGDDLQLAELKEFISKAKKTGLTSKEINDLARKYGQEFGEKAFSKLGEPLTSVNAKLFENTRKSLKDIARNTIKGDVAKQADELMSKLYNTKNLISKNVEAVAKLRQKIRDRGLFEKVGYSLAKYADVLSGGTIRGIMGGLLPRGVGYKTLNALDLEKHLKKNLEVIQKAIKSKSDDEINRILSKLDDSIPKGKGEILKSKPLKSKTPTNPLIQEAKKYKSAEEFVEAQVKKDYVLEVRKTTVNDIAKVGTYGEAGSAKTSARRKLASDITNKEIEIAQRDQKLFDTNKNKTIEQLQNEITETKKWADENNTSYPRSIQVKEEIIKTKSQLTDIWNKAQKLK